MTNFEAPESFAANKDLFTDNAASQWAREAWRQEPIRRPGEQAGSLTDNQLSSRLATITSNDYLLNLYLNDVKAADFSSQNYLGLESQVKSGLGERTNQQLDSQAVADASKGVRPDIKNVVDSNGGSDKGIESQRGTKLKETDKVEVHEYRNLKNSYRNDKGGPSDAPDATVIIPKGFDPSKPVRVVIFNHGLKNSGKGWADASKLAEQMAQADPNTILVVPEWQRNPGSMEYGNAAFQPNFFRNQLQEIFDNTPQLRNKKVDDIESMGIIAHSAGGRAAKAQLTDNGFQDKVTSVTVLDARYDDKIYSGWVQNNAADLQSGKKSFLVFHQNDAIRGTGQNRREVLERETKEALGRYQVPDSAYDKAGNNKPDDPKIYSLGGVVFVEDKRHDALPKNHVAGILKAERGRKAAGR